MKFQIISKAAQKVGPVVGKALLKCKKYSPEILLVAGIAGGVACVVLACKETHDGLDDIIEEHKSEMENVTGAISDEKSKRMEIVKVVAHTIWKLIKLYLPSVCAGALSIACVLGSHGIMLGRVAGLTAAYTAVDEAFKDYRARVVEKYGEEEDFRLRYGISDEVTQITVTEKDKDGNDVEVVKDAHAVNISGHSQYAKFFDQSCDPWEKDPYYNYAWLQSQEEVFTVQLNTKGYVFLNEVYHALGIPETPAGQVVGWLKDAGDNYIDFGFRNKDADFATRRFVNGLEPVVLLDFNVDGVIYDKI